MRRPPRGVGRLERDAGFLARALREHPRLPNHVDAEDGGERADAPYRSARLRRAASGSTPGFSSMLGISGTYDVVLQRKCLYRFSTAPGFSVKCATNAFPWPTHFAASIDRPALTVSRFSSRRLDVGAVDLGEAPSSRGPARAGRPPQP